MHYIIGTLIIVALIAIPTFIYFLYMVDFRRHQTIIHTSMCDTSFKQSFLEATMDWSSIKSTWLGNVYQDTKPQPERLFVDDIVNKSRKINEEIAVNIIGHVRDYQKDIPEYAPDHMLLYAMAHLLENELDYYTAHEYNHYIAKFIDRGNFTDDDLPGYVLESISDKEVSSRIKAIIRNSIRNSILEGYNYETIIISIVQRLARTIKPKGD